MHPLHRAAPSRLLQQADAGPLAWWSPCGLARGREACLPLPRGRGRPPCTRPGTLRPACQRCGAARGRQGAWREQGFGAARAPGRRAGCRRCCATAWPRRGRVASPPPPGCRPKDHGPAPRPARSSGHRARSSVGAWAARSLPLADRAPRFCARQGPSARLNRRYAFVPASPRRCGPQQTPGPPAAARPGHEQQTLGRPAKKGGSQTRLRGAARCGARTQRVQHRGTHQEARQGALDDGLQHFSLARCLQPATGLETCR
jgi:hypothetical protein